VRKQGINGGSRTAGGSGYSGDSESERLRRENAELRRQKIQREGEERIAALNRQAEDLQKTLPAGKSDKDEEKNKAKDGADAAQVLPVSNIDGIATSLGNRSSRNMGFYGMSGEAAQRNTIKACAYGEQTISDGQNLRFRLLEPMQVAGQLLPVGAILIGAGKIGIDRLYVSILSVEHQGIITKVALDVYDSDGQQGLFVPGSLELEAGKEIGADIATSVGSSASSSTSMFSQQSAAEQIKADVGRGTVQGVFRYVGKRLQQIKVTVQDKHKVFLVPQNN
jgi:conjugative transposon TraM protein